MALCMLTNLSLSVCCWSPPPPPLYLDMTFAVDGVLTIKNQLTNPSYKTCAVDFAIKFQLFGSFSVSLIFLKNFLFSLCLYPTSDSSQ